MNNIVLCIDDSPIRYRWLAEYLKARNIIVICVDRPSAVELYLEAYRGQIVGICLDHDMPVDGAVIAREHLCELSIPVAIVSNNKDAVPCIKHRIEVDHEWNEQLMIFFDIFIK